MTADDQAKLFKAEQALHNEADDFIATSRIFDLLRPYGELLIEGSYAYHTMIDRDIDIRVIIKDNAPNIVLRNQIIQTILAINNVWKLHMVDHANYHWSDDPRAIGIWIGPQIIHNDHLWNFDIWVFDELNGHKNLEIFNQMKNISEENRASILEIKQYCLENNLKIKGSTSVDIYRAVLDNDISSPQEYLEKRTKH
jgi:hypothetical protein